MVESEETFKDHPVQPPAMVRDTSYQTKLLKAPANLA